VNIEFELSMRLPLFLCLTFPLLAADEPAGSQLYRQHCAT
jgi:hypothetical protein